MARTRNPNRNPRAEAHEKRLVAGMARGETSALEGLYGLYRPRLGRFLSRMGVPEDDQDAICNEVMLVAWDKAGTYQPRASRVSTWLFGIARFKALKLFDATRRRPPTSGETFEHFPQGNDAEHRLRQRDWLQVAMAALPPEQRQVVELTFFEGLSYSEIAGLMNCPENTVKTRMFHARRKLRTLLETGATAQVSAEEPKQ